GGRPALPRSVASGLPGPRRSGWLATWKWGELVTGFQLTVRKTVAQVEEIRAVAGRSDEGGPLRRVAVAAVARNPYAGRGFVEDLSELIEASGQLGTMLGEGAVRLLGAP